MAYLLITADPLLLLGGQVLKNRLVITTINTYWCPLGHLTREANSQADISADLPALVCRGQGWRQPAGSGGGGCISFLGDSRTWVPKRGPLGPRIYYESSSKFNNVLTWVGVHSVCWLNTEMVSIRCKSSSSISSSVSARAMRPRETIW